MSTSEDEVDVRVLFFGKARELVECGEANVRIPRELPYVKLKEIIFNELFDVLQCISSSCVLAVDLRYANNDEIVKLKQSSEIAVIPPLSGG